MPLPIGKIIKDRIQIARNHSGVGKLVRRKSEKEGSF